MKKFASYVASVLACASLFTAIVPAYAAGAEAPKIAVETVEAPVVAENDKALVDYTHASDGYIEVEYKEETTSKLKCQVASCDGAVYTYNLKPGKRETFLLTCGAGCYKVTVFRGLGGSKYITVFTTEVSAAIQDINAVYLNSNQYVDWKGAEASVAKAAELCQGLTMDREKINAVYNYVISNLTYDREKAATVQSGYLPVIDDILTKKTGICFDYAALMAGMLRSQGVPCKLVVGNVGGAQVRHAWVQVYANGQWTRMDPTFASSGMGSASIMQYIGNGENYQDLYFY